MASINAAGRRFAGKMPAIRPKIVVE